MAILVILSRWMHLICACLAIGGIFFIRFIAPRGLALLDEESRNKAMRAMRRGFKMVMHSAILLLLVTGIYNTVLAWDKYKLDEAALHALWGTHVLLAAMAFTIALYVLARPDPPKNSRRLMAINFAILLLAVAAASSLKWARERAMAAHVGDISISDQR